MRIAGRLPSRVAGKCWQRGEGSRRGWGTAPRPRRKACASLPALARLQSSRRHRARPAPETLVHLRGASEGTDPHRAGEGRRIALRR